MTYCVRNLITGNKLGVGNIARILNLVYDQYAETMDFETTDINSAYRYKEAMELSFIEYKYQVETI